MSTKVIVNGADGRMGQVTAATINNADDFELVAALGKKDNLYDTIKATKAQIVIDFTVAAVVFDNVSTIIAAGCRPVVGTSGLLPEQITTLKQQCQQQQLGGIIAPNFSIGAVLLMKYAADAAKYLPDVEIIEMHHNGKQDSPSGTALKTALKISKNRAPAHTDDLRTETVAGARGAKYQDIHIHAVRLPGLMAHEAVIFGGEGETLTLRHDSINRECFMPGVLLACRKVLTLHELMDDLADIL